jgi:hypothetical protein
MANNTEQSTDELTRLVHTFFTDFLDVVEESDSGTLFHPIFISCCRCMKIEPLNKLLAQMREQVGLEPFKGFGNDR